MANGVHANSDPFPDDAAVAPLLTHSFEKLAARDPVETSHLLAASLDTGFFHLDLRNSEDGQSILKLADKIFEVAKAIFNIPSEEKDRAELGRGVVATRSVAYGFIE
jgi:isopenicillin N synthase-like dioxygenase